MGLPGCLFVCHLILLLMCFLFNWPHRACHSQRVRSGSSSEEFYSQAQTQAQTISTQSHPVLRTRAQPYVNQTKIQAQAQAQPPKLA